MAIIDTHTKPRGKFKLSIHAISPERIEPLGDRYTIEEIELDEKIELGRLLVVTQDPIKDPRDPQNDPRLENRGVMAAVIIRAGNGHLLGLPDLAVALVDDAGELMRAFADVPMFCEPGDVVFVDYNAKGRAVKILGRECRLVNQIDILARIDGIKLKRVDDEWESE